MQDNLNPVQVLSKAIGYEYMYKSRKHQIRNIIQENPEADVEIQTSILSVRVRPRRAVEFFTEHFLPVADAPVPSKKPKTQEVITVKSTPNPFFAEVQPKRQEQMLMQDKGIVGSLRDTLLDSIDKIKENEAYTKQAEAINKTAKTLIELAKAKLEFHKFKRDL